MPHNFLAARLRYSFSAPLDLIGDLLGGGTSLIHAEPPVIVHHKLRRSVNVR